MLGHLSRSVLVILVCSSICRALNPFWDDLLRSSTNEEEAEEALRRLAADAPRQSGPLPNQASSAPYMGSQDHVTGWSMPPSGHSNPYAAPSFMQSDLHADAWHQYPYQHPQGSFGLHEQVATSSSSQPRAWQQSTYPQPMHHDPRYHSFGPPGTPPFHGQGLVQSHAPSSSTQQTASGTSLDAGFLPGQDSASAQRKTTYNPALPRELEPAPSSIRPPPEMGEAQRLEILNQVRASFKSQRVDNGPVLVHPYKGSQITPGLLTEGFASSGSFMREFSDSIFAVRGKNAKADLFYTPHDGGMTPKNPSSSHHVYVWQRFAAPAPEKGFILRLVGMVESQIDVYGATYYWDTFRRDGISVMSLGTDSILDPYEWRPMRKGFRRFH